MVPILDMLLSILALVACVSCLSLQLVGQSLEAPLVYSASLIVAAVALFSLMARYRRRTPLR